MHNNFFYGAVACVGVRRAFLALLIRENSSAKVIPACVDSTSCAHLATAKMPQMKISTSLLSATSASFVCVNQPGGGSVVRHGNDPPCVNTLTAVWISLHIFASSGIRSPTSLPVWLSHISPYIALSASAPATLANVCVPVSSADLSPRLFVT